MVPDQRDDYKLISLRHQTDYATFSRDQIPFFSPFLKLVFRSSVSMVNVFGMPRAVGSRRASRRVVPPPDDLALTHHHGPYRHLSFLEGPLGLTQRLAEEVVMGGIICSAVT